MKAIWNGKTIAESKDTIQLEGNHYFPIDSIEKSYFKESELSTVCPWKGTASYYNLEIDGKANKDAAWYYENPKDAAQSIRGHVAFWKGVEITE